MQVDFGKFSGAIPQNKSDNKSGRQEKLTQPTSDANE